MKQYNDNSVFYKSFKHIAFSAFWILVACIVVILFLRLNQWNNEQLQVCMDRGYSLLQCQLTK
jgi:hypothetical protein